jgi:fluoride ion exporter CrcB/FEX
MKRPGYIITVSLFAILAIADIVHDCITNDPVSYFSQQPRQLLVVVALGIVGGLVTFFWYRLSTHWQRRVKLIALGFTAGFATFAGAYFSLLLAHLPDQFIRFPSHLLLAIALGIIAVAGLLWFEFYEVFRKHEL